MTIRYLAGTAIATSLASIYLGIEQQPVTSQPLNCQAAQTQMEMNRCADQAAQVADGELNWVYRRVRSKYRGSRLEQQLIDAQLAWIRFRDLTCAFDRNRFAGGSIAPMIYSQCLERTTRQQTEELKKYLKEV
jgi:uncharacterized protein YecT (DUF1311 family)